MDKDVSIRSWGAWELDGVGVVAVGLSENGVHIEQRLYRWDELRSSSMLRDSWMFTPESARSSMRIRPREGVSLQEFCDDVAHWRGALERRLRGEAGEFMAGARGDESDV